MKEEIGKRILEIRQRMNLNKEQFVSLCFFLMDSLSKVSKNLTLFFSLFDLSLSYCWYPP